MHWGGAADGGSTNCSLHPYVMRSPVMALAWLDYLERGRAVYGCGGLDCRGFGVSAFNHSSHSWGGAADDRQQGGDGETGGWLV